MPVNQITILTLTLITITLIMGTLIMMRGPKKIEKYTSKIYNLWDQYKFFENDDSYESFEGRKKIFRKEKKAYKKLANNIKYNVGRIMKRNKDLNGRPIIANKAELLAGINRLQNATFGETSQREGTHTLNKSAVLLCDANHPSTNTLTNVILHELGHVINEEVGHGYAWQQLFETLQAVANKQGWYDKYQKVESHTYCGGKYLNI